LAPEFKKKKTGRTEGEEAKEEVRIKECKAFSQKPRCESKMSRGKALYSDTVRTAASIFMKKTRKTTTRRRGGKKDRGSQPA